MLCNSRSGSADVKTLLGKNNIDNRMVNINTVVISLGDIFIWPTYSCKKGAVFKYVFYVNVSEYAPPPIINPPLKLVLLAIRAILCVQGEYNIRVRICQRLCILSLSDWTLR